MTTKKKVDWRIICVGIVCLTAVEITALLLGHNGVMLNAFFVIIALAIGISIKRPKVLE